MNTESTIPTQAPDWQVVAHDVTCPMCDYNLRGLAEPVCPECGYRFAWPDVIDPARRLHPYLFEHHPARNVRSFLETLVNHLHPVRFWRTMNPAQRSRPGRIVIYWTIYAAATMLPAIAGIVAWYRFQSLYFRLRRLPGPPLSIAALPWRHDPFVRLLLVACAIWLLYPWLSFLTLMVFRQSMRRVRVKSSHVLRCAIYCGDVMLWNTLWASGVIVWYLFQGRLARTHDLAVLLVAGSLAAGTINIMRLWAAYRIYMKFDRALATIIASQVIVALGVFAALVHFL